MEPDEDLTSPEQKAHGHVYSDAGAPIEELRIEAMEQRALEKKIKREDEQLALPIKGKTSGYRRLEQLIELVKSRKTARTLLQIWQSDYSIVAYLLAMTSFYVMKTTRYPPIGLFFFILAMAAVDAILSIFVVRLSFQQDRHGFYRAEDFERDWLRYRILLSMTKAALLFVVLTSCGTATVVASYIVWFFTATLRLRFFILRWSVDEHYPELQRWSIFALLREAGVQPKRRHINLIALLGVAIGFAIVFLFR
jgi:hypothetical protein